MRRLIALSIIGVIAAATHTIADDIRPPTNLPPAVNDTDYYESGRPSADKVELGRLLFFDKILSGNKNIACGTCHHPDEGTSDGLALGLGEGELQRLGAAVEDLRLGHRGEDDQGERRQSARASRTHIRSPC